MKNKYLIVLIIILIFSSCGTDEVIEDPIVNQAPEKVTFTTVISTPNGGKVSWNPSVDPENDTVNYKVSFEKKTTTSADFEILDTQTISETSYEAVASLQLNATYRLIVTAIDIDNDLESEPSEKIIMVQSPVTNLTSNYNIDTNCLTLNWESTNNNIINYKIKISRKGINYDTTNPFITYFSDGVFDETGNSNTTFTICGLPLINEFIFAIIAVENNGVEFLSSESISVKTVPRIYNGNLNIVNQYKIDILENGSLEKVTGNLSIGTTDECSLFAYWCCFDGINDLSPFLGLKEVGGNLKIGKSTNGSVLCVFSEDSSGFEELETIGGDLFINAIKNVDFPSLTAVNTLDIQSNDYGYFDTSHDLTSIKFNQLITIENLAIANLPNLNVLEFNSVTTINSNLSIINTNIATINFDNLTQINGNELSIMDNDNLDLISGFPLSSFNGNITITGNNNITSLDGFEGLTQIENIKISNNSNLSTISGFSNLAIVNNDFEIIDNNITSLDGFQSLTEVENIKINYNSNLSTISGFSNLEIVNNDFEIIDNNITSLDGFEGLTQIENIKISNNSNLSTISGFSNLAIVNNDFEIMGNNSITSLNGFTGLTQVENIKISNNSNLSTISGFSNLEIVNNDFEIIDNNITSLDGFQSLTEVENIKINYNSNLSTISGFSNLEIVNNDFEIMGNNSITSLNGFTGLTQVENIKISNNSNLSTISGFSNLEIVNNGFNIQNNISLSNLSFNGINYIGKEIIIKSNDAVNSITLPAFTYNTNTPFVLQLENNNNLSSITGFSNIQNLDKLIIKDNGNLSNIDLTNLVTVENYLVIINNDNIGDLDFLSNLTTIACGNSYSNNGHTGNLILENNYNLHDFCGLKPFFTSSGLCSNNYYIGQNAYNPTHYDIVNNNCSN